MRGVASRKPGLVLASILLVLVVLVIPAPAAPITATVPYSATVVADGDLEGNPATGAWSDAGSWTIPLENGAASPYGSATLLAKHDGTYVYFRIDGSIDVPWTSAGGNHFWFGIIFNSVTTGHHASWQDGVFFGEDAYTSAPPLLAVDTYGGNKLPTKDGQQDNLGRMAASGAAAPYSFTAEWKRKLNTGDANDLAFVADGTTSYYFYATSDSNGGGSSGGAINHKVTTNDNVIRFASVPAGDTTPPTVSITAPANGAFVTGIVPIDATATDNVGGTGVAKVEFYVDGTLKGTDTTPPYGYSWDTSTATEGVHQLVAKAYDGANNIGTSATVSVTVDRTVPTVAITAPTNGAVLKGIVTIDATATDSSGVTKVELYVDGALLGTDTTSPYSQLWDTSTVAEGLRQVQAKAYDTVGNTRTSTIGVTVDRTAPVAAAGADRLIPPGTTVTFDGSGSTDANGIANYTWTFTDGTPRVLYTVFPSYTFNNLGSFLVTLTVADPAGNTGTDSLYVNVTSDTQPPVARAGPAQAVLQGTLVTLDGSQSTDDVSIANYTWTFMDGTSVTLWGRLATYRFVNVGDFIVNLTVSDYTGKTGTGTTWVNVSADTVRPTAMAGPDRTVDRGTLVTLDGLNSTDNVGIANYTWAFTDAAPVTLWGSRVTYGFMNVGNFSVLLTVRDYAGNPGTDAAWVNVTPDRTPPVANAGPDQAISILENVTFNGTSSTDNVGIVNYTWTFTDGGPVTLWGAVVTYRFHHGGNFSVLLTVLDLADNSGTDSLWVNVSALPVIAVAGPDRTITLGDTVTLDGSNSAGNGGIVDYNWRVEGTPTVLLGAVVNFTPSAGGNLTVNLTVRDAADLSASDLVLITVIVPDRTPPSPLGSPTVATLGPGAVTLTWDPSTAPDLAGYFVFRSESPEGPFVQLNADPLRNTTYVDAGLLPGHAYYYYVVAVDQSGNASQPSPTASGAAGLAPPEPFNWLAIRWAFAPVSTGLVLAILAVLSSREDRRRMRAASPPPTPPPENTPPPPKEASP